MNIGVVFAGGVGSRMRCEDIPKQFLQIHGKPVIVHTLEHFERCDEVDLVVVACVEGWIGHLNDLVARYGLGKVRAVVPGGATGQLSIYNGLCAAEGLAPDGRDTVVLIHDGVRPLISSGLLSRNIDAVRAFGSSVTCAPVTETLVEAGEGGSVRAVLDRACSRVAKAPQCFYLDQVIACHRQALADGRDDFIDTCTLMSHYGHSLHLTDGPTDNIKVTTPEDFYTLRTILESRENAQFYGVA